MPDRDIRASAAFGQVARTGSVRVGSAPSRGTLPDVSAGTFTGFGASVTTAAAASTAGAPNSVVATAAANAHDKFDLCLRLKRTDHPPKPTKPAHITPGKQSEQAMTLGGR
jgi:hypothetical protein